MAPELNVPEAPAMLPVKLQEHWRKTYADAFEQAKADEPDDLARQKMLARREANRILRTPKLTSYEQAVQLAEWQVVLRAEVDGMLKVVTCDGKKYRFPTPVRASKPVMVPPPPDPNAGKAQGAGAGQGEQK